MKTDSSPTNVAGPLRRGMQRGERQPRMWGWVAGLILCGLLIALYPAWADESAGFKEWLTAFEKEALDRGVSKGTLDKALRKVAPIPRVIELDRNQPEMKLTLDEYLNLMISTVRVAKGRTELKENRDLLETISARYGVQPRYLVTLWGIESDFGRLTGGFPVIGALATLAYDGRRSTFFRRELFKALRILEAGHISVARMTGSWAGAMGQMQFMPSTFQGFAVDFNENGRVNIWSERPDIFASAANYLAKSGWKGDQIWGREVQLPTGFDSAMIGLKTRKPISHWQASGVRRLNGTDLPAFDLTASIIRPDGAGGRTFMVYNNYRVLLKWNRSHSFALAVGLLSDRIGNR